MGNIFKATWEEGWWEGVSKATGEKPLSLSVLTGARSLNGVVECFSIYVFELSSLSGVCEIFVWDMRILSCSM